MNDVDNWQELIDSYSYKMLKIARGVLNNEEDAKDVCQEVFIKFFETSNVKNPEAWLYKTTINYSINFKKQILARKSRENKKRKKNFYKNGNIKSVEIQEELEIIQKEIVKLPEKQRAVFLLRYQNNMNIKEIANLLNITEGTVKKHLNRVMEKFHEKFFNIEKPLKSFSTYSE